MEPVNNNNDRKRERESLENSELVNSVSSPFKRQKAELESDVKNINGHPTSLSQLTDSDAGINHDKKRNRGLLEADDPLDLHQLPSKRHKIGSQVVNDGALIVAGRPSLLEFLLMQHDNFSFFSKKTLIRLTKINRSIVKKYIEFTNNDLNELKFNVSLWIHDDAFNKRAKNMIRKLRNIHITLSGFKCPFTFGGEEYSYTFVRTPSIYLSPYWKNITLAFDDGNYPKGIKIIDIMNSGEINVLKLHCTFSMDYRVSMMFRFMGDNRINAIEIDMGTDKNPLLQYRLANQIGHNNKITSIHFEKTVISISACGQEDYSIDWSDEKPLKSQQGLEHLKRGFFVEYKIGDRLPLSLKSIDCYNEIDLTKLFDKDIFLNSVTISRIHYKNLQEILNRCTTKNLIVERDIYMDEHYIIPDDYKIILPVTLESCAFTRNFASDYEEWSYISGPFLDFSLTNMKSMKTDPLSVLILPPKCVHIDLTYISKEALNRMIPNEDWYVEVVYDELVEFFDDVQHPEFIEAWTWPINMESLIIETSNHFNCNPYVPKTLKYLKFNRMNVNPNLACLPSGVILEAKIPTDVTIDFSQFPDVLTGMHITMENATIFQKIGHLHNIERLSVHITDTVRDTIVFQCPLKLQDLQISAHKKQTAEMHILPNERLSRVVYNHIKVIIDSKTYKGALYRQKKMPDSLYRLS